ncbi:hypothetical protein CH293_12190 [Rhodococcus sp. 14-2470-1b]|nr:hypothetical protein CH293_12190 [Rhodococcus sp. 14-2470-1b]
MLVVFAALGAAAGAAATVPVIGVGGFVVPAVVGGLAGLFIGAGAVAGGHVALATDRMLPARSVRLWKHRFAACSTAAVALLALGAMTWAMASTGDTSLDRAGFPTSAVVLVVLLIASHVCAYTVAPNRREST